MKQQRRPKIERYDFNLLCNQYENIILLLNWEFQKAKYQNSEVVSHWHPNITLCLVTDYTEWTPGMVPSPINECKFVQVETNYLGVGIIFIFLIIVIHIRHLLFLQRLWVVIFFSLSTFFLLNLEFQLSSWKVTCTMRFIWEMRAYRILSNVCFRFLFDFNSDFL